MTGTGFCDSRGETRRGNTEEASGSGGRIPETSAAPSDAGRLAAKEDIIFLRNL